MWRDMMSENQNIHESLLLMTKWTTCQQQANMAANDIIHYLICYFIFELAPTLAPLHLPTFYNY